MIIIIEINKINQNHLNYLLIFSFLIFRIIDLLTTFIGISKGINEINPFVRNLLENNLIIVIIIGNVVLIFIPIIFNYYSTKIKDIYIKEFSINGLLFLLIVLNILGVLVILNNSYQLILIDGVIQV